MTNTN